MSSDTRRRRPVPERTEPIRDWSTLFGESTPDQSDPDAEPTEHTNAVSDAVSRSVELGYRVIDDYLQQGRRVARQMGEGDTGPDVWATEVQDLGTRMARYASDFMGAWMELLELTARGGNGATPTGAPVHATPPPDPASGPPTPAAPPRDERVRLSVRSPVPLEIDVVYRSAHATGEVDLDALRADGAPPLTDVSFRAHDQPDMSTLVVDLADAPPPGTYHGLLVDRDTNRPVGSVRIVVADSAASPGN